MDKLTLMKTFARVVESGSFSAVAREMETSQSTISKRIATLETRLQGQLLTRSSRKLMLTEAGRGYYQRCLKILAAIEEADSFVGSFRETAGGTLRISIPVSFGKQMVLPKLLRYMRSNPEISLDLMMDDQQIDLIEEGVDLVVRVGDLDDSSLLFRTLGKAERLLVGTPEYFRGNGVPHHPEELSAHNCITYTGAADGNVWRFSHQGRELSVRVSGSFRSDNGESIKEAVMAGIGIHLHSHWYIRQELEAGTLIAVMRDYRPRPVPIHALFPRSRFVPLKVRRFLDYLQQEFDRDPLISALD